VLLLSSLFVCVHVLYIIFDIFLKRGATALIVACEHGQPLAAEFLLDSGADMNLSQTV
jgi:ankyrin repeat protein